MNTVNEQYDEDDEKTVLEVQKRAPICFENAVESSPGSLPCCRGLRAGEICLLEPFVHYYCGAHRMGTDTLRVRWLPDNAGDD